MNEKNLFDKISIQCSKNITKKYSTSFSIGIYFLDKNIHNDIYSIYGFVRLSDEIVDTFHNFNKEELLNELKRDTFWAIEKKISLNPILNSFQIVVNKYNISHDLIDTFLKSMEMDLNLKNFNEKKFEEYILGSAEVVGLMCLKVFTNNNNVLYEELKPYAMKLGSAFQKINFLRDIKYDYENLGRIYFPNIDIKNLSDEDKKKLIKNISNDFKIGLSGIKKLPKNSRFGVYIAYVYYIELLNKIKNIPLSKFLKYRPRISNFRKFILLFKSLISYSKIFNS